MVRIVSSIFCFLLLIISARSFSLPSVAPREFYRGDELQVIVNKLLSAKTLLPYDYYHLRYCRPTTIRNFAENLGEVLRGAHNSGVHNSVYKFHMREEQTCKIACRIMLDAQAAKDFKQKIDEEYIVNMILEDLPVVLSRPSLDGSPSTIYKQGFRVGFKGGYVGSEVYKYFIFNHLSFTVMYHRDQETESGRIVGFEVAPNSIEHEVEWNVLTCNKSTRYMIEVGAAAPQEVDTGKHITFSYDVVFKESEIKWASRWDAYHLMNEDQIQWFSIINSLLIMLFLCGMVAMIMIRTLYKDISICNQLEGEDETPEETGWKLILGDVFRPPLNFGMVFVCAGSGVQMLGTAIVTMIFALLSFLSPSISRGFLTTMVLLWLLFSFFGGYSSARLFRMFDTTEWKRSALKTALVLPSILLLVFLAVSALIWGDMSSWGIPFGTVFALAISWFGVSAPLVFLGGYFGFRKAAIEAPVKTHKIPREIPKQPWYLSPILSALISGIVPSVAVLVEFQFIQTFTSMNQICYIFGFLLVSFVILTIMCAEIAVVFCYLQLCSEDYKWWWRAYSNGGSSALYLFVYSVFFYFTELEMVPGILYMFIVSFAFFVVTGTIGFYACFWFVRTIYSSVKIY